MLPASDALAIAADRPPAEPARGLRDPAARVALLHVLGYFLLTRVVGFVAVAAAGRAVRTPAGASMPLRFGKNVALGSLLRWDATWYLAIAEGGYWLDPGGQSSVAFFPGFPLAVRALMTLGLSLPAAGLVAANLAALLGVIAFQAWVSRIASPMVAERASLWLLVFPFGFFLHTAYAESLFFLLVVLALDAAGRGAGWQAGLWGAVAATVRPYGVVLAPALLWGVLAGARREARRATAAELAAVCLPVGGLVLYLGYLTLAFGSPLVLWQAHAEGWGVGGPDELAGHWRGLGRVLSSPGRIHGFQHVLEWLHVGLPLVFVGLIVVAWRRLGPVPGLYALLVCAIGVALAPGSIGRELLAAVPAFAAAGFWPGSGRWAEALRVSSFGLLLLLLVAFASGHFVG